MNPKLDVRKMSRLQVGKVPVFSARLSQNRRVFDGILRYRNKRNQGLKSRLVTDQRSTPGAPVPPILPPQYGYPFLDKAKFAASFAGGVDKETAAFMADSQVP